VNKEEYAELLAEIGGGREIGIAARRERDAAEQLAVTQHEDELWGLLCLGDAVHQFYRDTLDLVRRTVVTIPVDEMQIAMVNWHIVSFERFAVAFHLMARAYYFEAIALARDLWEIALSLAGLKRNVVRLEELLGAGATDPRHMEQMSRDADARIRRTLLRDNPALDQRARDAVETFLVLANLSTHKSKLHLGLNFREVAQGSSISIFPRFEMKQAAVAQNILYLASWSLISTLPYLEFALPSADWASGYQRVQLAFQEGVGRGSDQAVQAWPTILEHVFGRTR